MNDDARVIRQIRDFIFENFPLARERQLGDRDSLLDGGIVDSMGVLDIVGFVEAEFDVELSDEDLVADAFETIAGIAAVVQQRRALETHES